MSKSGDFTESFRLEIEEIVFREIKGVEIVFISDSPRIEVFRMFSYHFQSIISCFSIYFSIRKQFSERI